MADKNLTALDWEDVRVFVALARYGSLSATARALSLTHATVSRRVRALELTLKETLLERRPDGYRLTPAGERVIGPAIDMEAASSRLRTGQAVSDGALSGLVRVNAPPSLVQAFLAPQLARLACKHPGLELDIVGDLRTVSLERRETDLGLRFEQPRDGQVITKLLAEIAYGFYGTARWQRRLHEGDAPVFIGFDEANAHLAEARWLSRHFPHGRCVLRANNHLAQAEAVRTGLGVALLPHFVGAAHPELKLCVLGPQLPKKALWMVKRRLDRDKLALRTVWNYLIDEFARADARWQETT